MINFFTEDIDFQLGNEDDVISWLRGVIESEEKMLQEVNYIFCSDDYLLKINQEYLQHDYYTDIITFPYAYKPIKSDIYISIDRIKDNAISNKVDEPHELLRVIIHGLLHMMGYNDKSSEEQALMREKENACLALIWKPEKK